MIGLVGGTPALGNDLCHLVHLSLRAAKGTEPLLGELARALVFAVAEEFDHAAFVGGESVSGSVVSRGSFCLRLCMCGRVGWEVVCGFGLCSFFFCWWWMVVGLKGSGVVWQFRILRGRSSVARGEKVVSYAGSI